MRGNITTRYLDNPRYGNCGPTLIKNTLIHFKYPGHIPYREFLKYGYTPGEGMMPFHAAAMLHYLGGNVTGSDILKKTKQARKEVIEIIIEGLKEHRVYFASFHNSKDKDGRHGYLIIGFEFKEYTSSTYSLTQSKLVAKEIKQLYFVAVNRGHYKAFEGEFDSFYSGDFVENLDNAIYISAKDLLGDLGILDNTEHLVPQRIFEIAGFREEASNKSGIYTDNVELKIRLRKMTALTTYKPNLPMLIEERRVS